MITYAPLMSTLHKKKISKTDLQEMTKMSPSTLAKIGKDEYVALKIIDKICNELDCNIEDVIAHVKTTKKNQNK